MFGSLLTNLSVLFPVAVSPGIAHPSTRTTLPDMTSNTPDKYPHNLARGYDSGTRQTRTGYPHSGQGARSQPSQPGVDGTLVDYPGSGIARTPAVYSPTTQPGQASPLLHTSYQPLNHSHVALSASHGGHSTSPRSNSMNSVPSGTYYAPNPPAAHTHSRTPASPMEQQWQELQPSPATRTTGGHVPPQSYGSNSTSSTSNSHHTRLSNLPRLGCKLPRCDKPAIFDQHINEQREYCEEHIKCAVSVGFARCCVRCRKMPCSS
ncbi:hypothetical protein BJY52DRAFT_729321 [Lactarius psammicola]|nr:hypothetical protein BJY52DRAFT_729321 [Lactarius psammicola]